MEYKFLPFSLETKAGDDGLFSGHGAAFNNEDSYKDIIVPGAFKRSMEKNAKVRMLWQHQSDKVIGKWLSMREDQNGLFMEGKLTKGVRLADEAYLLMKDGAIDGLSIGFSVPKDGSERKGDIRYLKHINLHEVSVVTFPANEAARVSGVKSLEDIDYRELESAYRDGGLSQTDAKKAVAALKDYLQRDVGVPPRDEAKEVVRMLEDLTKKLAA